MTKKNDQLKNDIIEKVATPVTNNAVNRSHKTIIPSACTIALTVVLSCAVCARVIRGCAFVFYQSPTDRPMREHTIAVVESEIIARSRAVYVWIAVHSLEATEYENHDATRHTLFTTVIFCY